MPAVPVAVATLAGVGAAEATAVALPAAAVALAALGVAWRRRAGLWVAALAAGLAAGWAARQPAAPAPSRPVRLSGRLEGEWLAGEGGWHATLSCRRYRQGRRATPWTARVRLTLPSAAGPPPSGGAVRVRGYLRRAPGLANRPALPPGAWRLWLKSRAFVEIGGEPGPLERPGRALRRRLRSALDRAGPGPGPALVRALVLGRAEALDGGLRRALRSSGLAHLVALSGLHVGLVTGLVLLAGAALPRPLRLALVVPAAALYLLLAGPRPALLRASAMAALGVCGLLLERPPAALNLLAAVAAGLLLGDPGLAGQTGFRLTFAATAGILWLGPRLGERWGLLPAWLRVPLAVSVAAQLGSLPWTASRFRLIAPGAPLVNLAAVPWTAVALATCLGWSAIALLSPAAAASLAPLLDAVAAPYRAVAAVAPRPVPVALGWPAAACLTAAVAAALLRPRRLLVPVAVAGTALVALSSVQRDREARLDLLDVGQGEALLLRDGGKSLLVDGGGWRRADLGGRVLVPVLGAAGVRRLDVAVLTHPDLDHCRGLVDLAAYLPIAEVWTAPGWRGRCARELLALPGPRLRPLWAGEEGRLGRWRFLALHPPPGERGDRNDRSLVLRAELPGGPRLLLTGDVEAPGEAALVRRWGAAGLAADLLKVAHHGSRSSTTPALLAASAPRLAIVSAGHGNRYGHPSPVVVDRLRRRGVALLRTDRSGQVRIFFRPAGGLEVRLLADPRVE